eukprot:jgi/Astpho2/3628/Aster-06918
MNSPACSSCHKHLCSAAQLRALPSRGSRPAACLPTLLAAQRQGRTRAQAFFVKAQQQDAEHAKGLPEEVEPSVPGNLFASNPAFAAAFSGALERQGEGALFSGAATEEEFEEEQTSPQEDMIQSALQVSRRKVRMYRRLEEQFKTAREEEEKQFERLHIALKGVKSDTAYLNRARSSIAAMNESEVERQIDQMVRFIKQEAQEKAHEIQVSAEEEFNIEKLQLLEAEKAKIRKEYERRQGQVEVKKKIETSKQLNESRIKVLQAREEAVMQLVSEAEEKLASIAKDKAQYKSLLTDLLVQKVSMDIGLSLCMLASMKQAFRKLEETSVVVRAREADVSIVKEVLEPARSKYQQTYSEDPPSASLDTSKHLPPAPKGGKSLDDAESCCGGIVVTSGDGRIVCSNTLDERLKISYQQNLPVVREQLFGAAEIVRG